MPRKLVVKTAAEIAKKWGDVTPGKSTYYEAETPKASATWEANTKLAKGTYKAAVADVKISDRFEGGVKGKAAKFARKVTDVGIARFGPGVSAAVGDMETGFTPYQGILATIEVPDRGPRGAVTNYDIVKKIGDPLHAKRLAVLGAAS
jgi:hypothetical protein